MKDKKAREEVDEAREDIQSLTDRAERLEVKLAENRCISRHSWWNNSGSERIDIEQMDKKLNALCDFLGVEWTVEPSEFVVIEPE